MLSFLDFRCKQLKDGMVVGIYPACDLSKDRLPIDLGDAPFSIVQAISDGFLFGLQFGVLHYMWW